MTQQEYDIERSYNMATTKQVLKMMTREELRATAERVRQAIIEPGTKDIDEVVRCNDMIKAEFKRRSKQLFKK